VSADTVLAFDDVTVWRRRDGSRRELLRAIEWTVERGEHWAILGPNGAGKTTLLRIAAARAYPSSGRAQVLGRPLGGYPVSRLHEQIGFIEPRLARKLDQRGRGLEIVLTGATGTLALLRDRIGADDVAVALELLELLGVSPLAEQPFADCSEGERARLLLARALMADPPLLLLDEPTAGLDLAGRELVLAALDRLAAARPSLTTVIVTHHVEELPSAATHALLIRDGATVAAGPVQEVLADGPLSECFGLQVRVDRRNGRFVAMVRDSAS
jgi:iron complex transport system ATP-binding protein